MKDMINDRLIILATAQECMTDAADKLEHWEKSLMHLEKSAFESINSSDKVLNMCKEGLQLVDQLQDTCHPCCTPNNDTNNKVESRLEEMRKLLQSILETSSENIDISHKIEGEAICQKEIKENITKSLCKVRESIDSSVACAEFMLAEL